MDSLGQYLKSQRESRRESLSAVATKTRIGLPFLQAIESDRWDQFSSEVMARGFVRSYGISLGVDLQDLLHRFDQTVRPVYQERESQKQPYKEQVVRVKPQESSRKGIGQIVSMVAAVVFLATLYMIGSQRFNEPPETPEPVAEETIEGTMPEIPEEVPPPAVRPPSPGSVPGPEPPPAVPSGPGTASGGPKALTLSMEALDLSWISIRIDGGDTKEVLLRPGETITWKADERFDLDLGNAGGAMMKLNGAPLDPFGPPGAVVKNIVLTAANLPEPAE